MVRFYRTAVHRLPEYTVQVLEYVPGTRVRYSVSELSGVVVLVPTAKSVSFLYSRGQQVLQVQVPCVPSILLLCTCTTAGTGTYLCTNK